MDVCLAFIRVLPFANIANGNMKIRSYINRAHVVIIGSLYCKDTVF